MTDEPRHETLREQTERHLRERAEDALMAMGSPTIGRVVHYVPWGDDTARCRAALVTDVELLTTKGKVVVYLCVFEAFGFSFEADVGYDEGREPGTWHWPERA